MCKSILEPGRPQKTIWRMFFACWISKATNTQSEYEIFIVFPLQQWLNERVSISRYLYIACLVYIQNIPRSLYIIISNALPAVTDVSCIV